jgi:hypothetical protein
VATTTVIHEPVPQQRATRGSAELLCLKPELKEEDDEEETEKAVKVTLLRQQHLVARSDDADNIPGYKTVYISSLNDHNDWVGNIKDVIAMSIRVSGMSLVDLTHDNGEASPNSAVKEEPAGPRGKYDVVDDDYYFF